RLYARVLRLLGPEARLAWLLAVANVALAAAQFVEPVLFGRIIDALVGAQSHGAPPRTAELVPLLAAWAGFGLFAMGAGVLIARVLRKTETLQSTVERHYSDLAERASDALSNVAVVQGFARVEAEVSGLRRVVERLLAAQIPVLSWWAVVAVLTRASTTLTMLAMFLVGIRLHLQNLASIGEIVMFMNFAVMLIGRLEQAVGFSNRVLLEAPRLADFFGVLDTVPALRDRPDAIDPGRVRGLVEFAGVSYSYAGGPVAVKNLSFTVAPGETVALVGPTGAGKSTALALLHR